jgi:flagellar basal-body rod protein FlgB
MEGYMSFLDSPQLALLERFLDVASMRQTLVTTNLANIDTPGYHTRDIDFRGELRRAMEGDAPGMTSPFVLPVRGLMERPDGNNVSADREAMLLAEVQLQFKAATAVIRAEFARLSTAIREGQ